MLINQNLGNFRQRPGPDGTDVSPQDGRAVGIVAASASVEARYLGLLTRPEIANVFALGLSGENGDLSDLGCVLMVVDDGPWREAVIGRCAELKAQCGCKIVCLYEADLDDAVRRARNLDVFIFLTADAPRSVIVSAVVLATYVNAFSLVAGMTEVPAPDARPSSSGQDRMALTARQTEVLQLLAKGYSNKAMARALLLSEPTVKLHLTALRRIFSASNRTEVLSKAMKLGVLPV
jgi:DNA-binding NarL/FixJ family response regulator